MCPRATPQEMRRMMPGSLHREAATKLLGHYTRRDGCYYGCRHQSGDCYDPVLGEEGEAQEQDVDGEEGEGEEQRQASTKRRRRERGWKRH